MPSYFVFPGGRLDRADWRQPLRHPLRRATVRRLAHHCDPQRATSLAIAALRETREETGLRPSGSEAGAAIDLRPLEYLGRAITPAISPIRYHARFFLARDARFGGRLRSNGELLDLAWYDIDRALDLPIIDVTRAMLEEVRSLLEGGGSLRQQGPLFIRYRQEVPRITRDGEPR